MTVAYTKGADAATQVKAADGGVLESFAAQSVNNGLPTFVSAATSADGTKVTVTFSKAMAALPVAPAGFAVTVKGTDDSITAVALDADPSKIDLTLATPITSYSDAVQVSYTAGTVQAADGGKLASFTAQGVTNNVPAPAPQFYNAEVTTQGDVSIYFVAVGTTTPIKMAIPDAAHMTAACAQFTVVVNGSPVLVTNITTTNTVGKIKFVLPNNSKILTKNNAVTIAYNKSNDPTVQMKADVSVGGGILESFPDQTVPNN